MPVIVDFTTDVLRHRGSTNVAVAGQARLLGFPEYRDVDKAQKVLESIDEDTLSNLPAIMQSENGTKVLVGPENVAQELKDTSVVMTKFDIGDGDAGHDRSGRPHPYGLRKGHGPAELLRREPEQGLCKTRNQAAASAK